MEALKFTQLDRDFLRGMHIDPQSTPVEDMIDALSQPMTHQPKAIIIPLSMAQGIIREFGDVNWDTYWAYVHKHRQQK